MKERYTFTLTPELQNWAKEHFKEEGRTFSAWIEIKLIELSRSVCILSGTSERL